MKLIITSSDRVINSIINIDVSASFRALAPSVNFQIPLKEAKSQGLNLGTEFILSVIDETTGFKKQLVNGYIFRRGRSSSLQGTIVNFTGFSKLADIVHSTAPNVVLQETDIDTGSKFELIKPSRAIKDSGRRDIRSILNFFLNAAGFNVKVNLKGASRIFTENELAVPEVTEGLFEFLERFARLRQLYITSIWSNDIILQTADGGELVNLTRGIINSEFNETNDTLFNIYDVFGQTDAGELSFEEFPDDNFARARDNNQRRTRRIAIKTEQASDKNSIKKRAVWQANNSRATSSTYTAKVAGVFSEDGMFWTSGQKVRVEDDVLNLNATFTLDGVSINFNLDEGITTTLTMLPPDAFTLSEVLPKRKTEDF